MKKKYKVTRDKKTQEIMVSYYRLKDVDKFRFAYLKDILANYETVIISISTNLMHENKDALKYIKHTEKYLSELNIEHRIVPIANTREKKVLGIKVGTQKKEAFNILLELPTIKLDDTFYDEILASVDIMLGVNLTNEKEQGFEELTQEFQKGFEKYLYDVEGFEHVLYDSVLIHAIRTNFLEFPDINI